MRLRVDDLTVDVDVRDARAVSHARGHHTLPCEPHRLHDLLNVIEVPLAACEGVMSTSEALCGHKEHGRLTESEGAAPRRSFPPSRNSESPWRYQSRRGASPPPCAGAGRSGHGRRHDRTQCDST